MWHEFAHDPRDPSYAPLRAADADRDVVRRVLGDAYAEGRLDREEFDERTDAVTASRTLGELPLLCRPGADDRLSLAPPCRRRQTVGPCATGSRYVAKDAAEAWAGLHRSSPLICWVHLARDGLGGDGFDANFPWPLFVMFGTGIPAFRCLSGREDIIADEIRRIEKKVARSSSSGDQGSSAGNGTGAGPRRRPRRPHGRREPEDRPED